MSETDTNAKDQTKFEHNLVKGSVVKQILIFAIPFIISNFIQSLYSVADMIIIGQFCGTESMAGVNIGGQVNFLMTNMVFGICSGATVLIGQYLGKGARKELNETIATLFTFLIYAAVILSSLMLIFRKFILNLIQTPIESYDEAMIYLVITTFGTFVIFGYNAFSAVMRGMGDSKRPLIFVSIACVTNIILDLIFVAVFGWKAAGAAIATVISQALSMGLCITFFRKNNFVFDFKLKSFKIFPGLFKTLMKIGVPTSIQNIITSISFMMMTTMVNMLGVTSSAAVGAVGKFNSFAILPSIAVSASIAAMSAQNIGAGEFERAKKVMKAGLTLAVCISSVMFIITQVFPAQIMSIFDRNIIKEGTEYIRMFSFDYLIVPLYFSINGLFIGAGHTFLSLIISVTASIIIRVPVAFLFGVGFNMGLSGIGLGAPCASLGALTIAFIFYLSGKWKKSTILNISYLE